MLYYLSQACALPPHACPTKISEDCLFLNVFTPTDAEAGKTKYPVMMFIHGKKVILCQYKAKAGVFCCTATL